MPIMNPGTQRSEYQPVCIGLF